MTAHAGHESLELPRDVEVIVIPHGHRTVLTRGTHVRVLQTLGDSATVSADFGGLFRVGPEDFEALGLAAPERPELDATSTRTLEERVWDVLRTCYDPEIPVDIVELGLVYDCTLEEPAPDGRRVVQIKMTLTAPGCGMGDVLAADITRKVEQLQGVARARVEVVFDPPWNPTMMSEAARLQLGFF